jgi:hypothetical protein
MQVPDDIPELEDRPQEERRRIWKLAEKLSGSGIRKFVYGVPGMWVLYCTKVLHPGISVWNDPVLWISLLSIVAFVLALDAVLLRRIHVRKIREHIPEAIRSLEAPGAGVLSPLVRVQYERTSEGDPGEKAE